MLSVRPLVADDGEWVRATLEEGWGSTSVARLGELVDAASLPGFVAERGQRVGLVTYADRADGVEVVTLQASVEGQGVGRALLGAVRDRASEAGASRLWLSTTNDNLRAFALYQRWGMDLAGVVLGGVDASRRVKPGIPETGAHGIALRHELLFELRLDR
ncbi:MAG: GNAT family N-acetyltransferase [Actinomycetota bacterium]